MLFTKILAVLATPGCFRFAAAFPTPANGNKVSTLADGDYIDTVAMTNFSYHPENQHKKRYETPVQHDIRDADGSPFFKIDMADLISRLEPVPFDIPYDTDPTENNIAKRGSYNDGRVAVLMPIGWYNDIEWCLEAAINGYTVMSMPCLRDQVRKVQMWWQSTVPGATHDSFRNMEFGKCLTRGVPNFIYKCGEPTQRWDGWSIAGFLKRGGDTYASQNNA